MVFWALGLEGRALGVGCRIQGLGFRVRDSRVFRDGVSDEDLAFRL